MKHLTSLAIVATLFLFTGCVAGPVAPTAPELRVFSAIPNPVPTATPVTLMWDVINGDTCTLSPGAVPVPCSGTRTLTPPQVAVTTYTLHAEGAGGAQDFTLKVFVLQE